MAGDSRIRQDEVHTRGAAIDDSLDPTDHDANAKDLADTLDALASQITKITGEDRWETPPVATIKDIVTVADSGIKSGVLIPFNFAGAPRRAVVTFATPFPSAAYAVTLAAEGANGKSFVPIYEDKTATGFVVNLSTNNLADLVAVGWHAIPNGEF